MENKKCGIYMLLCIVTRKVYIGSSVNIPKRVYNHLSSLRDGIHKNKTLQQDYTLHGSSSFTSSTLELCSKELLEDRELYWAMYYNSVGTEWGYNVRPISRNKEVKNKKKQTPVIAINVDTGTITEYISAKECSSAVGICYEGIWDAIRYWQDRNDIKENNRIVKRHLVIRKDIYDPSFDYIGFRKILPDGRQRGVRSDKGGHRVENWRGKNPVAVEDRKLGRKEIKVIYPDNREEVFNSTVTAGEHLGMNPRYINRVIYGEKKSYRGHRFERTGVCDRD